eukprot:scaffold158382_cov17-Tisochrysis_lutea.AAC.1
MPTATFAAVHCMLMVLLKRSCKECASTNGMHTGSMCAFWDQKCLQGGTFFSSVRGGTVLPQWAPHVCDPLFLCIEAGAVLALWAPHECNPKDGKAALLQGLFGSPDTPSSDDCLL